MSQPTVFERNPMLAEPGGRKAWQASFRFVLADLRAQLQEQSPQEIADRTGARWEDSAEAFHLNWLDHCFRITWPDLTVFAGDVDEPSPANVQGLLLYYLAMADGTPLAGQWIGFRELPDGWLYQQAFQGYTGNRLVKMLGNDATALMTAARTLGGTVIEPGDYGFSFVVLPRVQLAVVYWLGDDEFEPEAQVLFDSAASRYLPTDGLAQLGSGLVSRILKEASCH